MRPVMRACALLVLAACGGGGGARPAAVPVRDASAPDAAPHVDAATACAPLRPEPSNPVLGAFPRAPAPLVGPNADGGGSFDLASLRGKVVLVSFASTWDALTKEERPTFRELVAAVGDEVAIVRVLSEASPEVAMADVRGAEGYVTVYDAERSCSPLGVNTNAWGVKAVPESFLVDRAGNVRFYFVNKRDWSTPEAIACVRALLADTTPPIVVPPLGAHAADDCPPPPPPPAPGTARDGEIRGTITFKHPPKPGVIFVLVKQADASGNPTGMPLAVDRIAYDGKPVAFVLDETKQLVSGTPIDGDVIVSARWDQDGDAMTKQPGDITGTVRVTAPSSHVKLVLDTKLP